MMCGKTSSRIYIYMKILARLPTLKGDDYRKDALHVDRSQSQLANNEIASISVQTLANNTLLELHQWNLSGSTVAAVERSHAHVVANSTDQTYRSSKES
eukprot:15628-Heterococcus_DN1.PRE.4